MHASPGAHFGEGLTRLPSLAAVVAEDRVGVVRRPLLARVPFSIPARGPHQPALFVSMAKGDAMVVHMHRWHVALAVGLDHGVLCAAQVFP